MKKGFEMANQVYEKIEDKSSLLLPLEMYLSPFDFNEKISQFVTIQSGNLSNSLRSIDYASLPQPSFNKNFEFLVEKLKQWKENDYRIIICAEQESQLNRLKQIFKELDQHGLCSFIQLGYMKDLLIIKIKVAFTDHQIFERYHRFSIKKTIKKAKNHYA